MPRKCCVPDCRGNYDKNEKISVFTFPTDADRLRLWLSKIPRANFEPTSYSVVCAKHFSEEFIIKKDSVTRPDGSVLTVERSIPKLSVDAYPSIFPNCPSYLSGEPPAKRKKPDDRRAELLHRDEQKINNWLEADKIKDFSDFSRQVTDKVDSTLWMYRLHSNNNTTSDESTGQSSYWSFYRIKDFPATTVPSLVSAIRVFTDLHVEIFLEKVGRVPDSSVWWLFGQKSSPVLTCWSQFDTLLSHFSTSRTDGASAAQQMQLFIDGLQKLCSNDKTENGDEDKCSLPKERLQFLVEQLKLLISPVNRYCCETLLWSFQIFASAPQAYSMLRNTLLTLPHPSYLKRLASVFNIGSGLKQATIHEQYLKKLKQKCQSMTEGERHVMLMLDEIHVAQQMSYKEGKLKGSALNCCDNVSGASTAQVFMISSLLSKCKDVVAIVPVKNINARLLHEWIMQVLKMLHDTGYTVICVISDNNRINRNAFTSMCGGTLQLSIENPFKSSERLFFLFDTVHLFKCIRNNWLAQKDVEKTFLFPSLHSCENSPLKASFSHLQKLYSEEKSSMVKLAPALNQKCLYPTSTEKQNVKLMLKIFDQRNIIALEHFEKAWQTDTRGTREFLNTVVRLWTILNVKQPFKNIRLRNEDCRSITSPSDQNMQFISKAIEWLHEWQKLCLKPREGTLSTETMTALRHTLSAITELTTYLLQEKQFKYVLLGKFQTDNLEFRFSQYRQMSGCNFHVSVQQLLEGEKKLKLMSVLKMISASNGALSLKDMMEPLEEARDHLSSSSSEQFQKFLPVLKECDSVELNSEQLKALVFVAGYCVSKVVRQTDCETCQSDFRVDCKLQVETTEDCYTYLSALDRGGLTWPSDYAVGIVTQIFRIFQLLIGNAKHEQEFLLCGNQRGLIMNLALQRLSELDMTQKQCEDCGMNCGDLAAKCCRPAVNIFLNNYSKTFTDKASGTSNARKLKTFTKRI